MRKALTLWMLVCLLCAAVYGAQGETAFTTLRRGDSGEAVLAMKQRLYELGYYTTDQFNAYYNDNTAQHVMRAQEMNGLNRTGVASVSFLTLLFSDDVLDAQGHRFGGDTAETKTLPPREDAALPIGKQLATPTVLEDGTVVSEENTGMDWIPEDDYPYGIRSGSRDSKKIAITMDDCYNLEWVRDTFEMCEQYGIGITFYPVGTQLKEDVAQEEGKELWQRIAASACEIGTHTHQHRALTGLSDYHRVLYAKYPQAVLDELLGYHYPIQSLRPPFGSYNSTSVRRSLEAVGYHHVILWDVATTDPDEAFRKTQNGSILLFHAKKKDVLCLEKLIPRLLEAGFEPVPVTELLGIAPLPVTQKVFVWDMDEYYPY